MKLFHTSPTKIHSIDTNGSLGESFCFSSNVYITSRCDVLTYSIDIDVDDVISVSSFFYDDNYEMLDGILDEIMVLTGCSRDFSERLLSQESSYVGDSDIDLRIQGFAGDAAKILGYRAAMGYDEQGAVYIVNMRDELVNLSIESE